MRINDILDFYKFNVETYTKKESIRDEAFIELIMKFGLSVDVVSRIIKQYEK
jgi:hypothetical protein